MDVYCFIVVVFCCRAVRNSTFVVIYTLNSGYVSKIRVEDVMLLIQTDSSFGLGCGTLKNVFMVFERLCHPVSHLFLVVMTEKYVVESYGVVC